MEAISNDRDVEPYSMKPQGEARSVCGSTISRLAKLKIYGSTNSA